MHIEPRSFGQFDRAVGFILQCVRGGETKASLARSTGLTAQQITRCENGGRLLMHFIDKLCQALHVVEADVFALASDFVKSGEVVVPATVRLYFKGILRERSRVLPAFTEISKYVERERFAFLCAENMSACYSLVRVEGFVGSMRLVTMKPEVPLDALREQQEQFEATVRSKIRIGTQRQVKYCTA